MNSEHTPTTENIRQTFAYVQAGLDHDDGSPMVMDVHLDAFDRWLDQVKAEAWDDGWLARGNHDHHTNMTPEARAKYWFNPYRIEGDDQ